MMAYERIIGNKNSLGGKMTTPSTYKLGYPPLKYSVVPFAGAFTSDPTTSDVSSPTVGGNYKIGTMWVNTSTNGVWVLTGIVANAAQWQGVTDPATGNVDGPASATDNAIARFDGTTGKLIQNSVGILSDTGVLTGITSAGIGIAPTAQVTIAAGTAVAGTAPLKLTAGVNLGTPEAGAIEYDGTNLTYTDGTATRRTVVSGPASSTDNALVRFDSTTGKIIKDSVGILSNAGVLTGITQMGIGIAPTSYLTLAAGTATAGTAPLKLTLGVNLGTPEAGAIEYDGTFLTYTNNAATRNTLTVGPTSTTDNRLVKFDGAAGAIQQQNATTLSDADVMTFPAQGGVVMTSGGAGARKGTSVFGAGGVSAAIATTAVAADSVIVITRTNLAGAAAALGQYVTITPATSFIVTSGDAADTSAFTWAIVG